MLYLDLERLFEYKKTGVSYLDKQADSIGCIGITIPIVTEKTSKVELKNNPCAPFYTMNRFIMTDLNRAEENLAGYNREHKAFMDQSVIYGLKTRLWLDMATRFEKNPADLQKQIEAENADDGYDNLGISSALECYQKAAYYAQQAIGAGNYTPLTEEQWSDPDQGFNTANNSWMLGTLINSKEQINELFWYTFLGYMASEATGVCALPPTGLTVASARVSTTRSAQATGAVPHGSILATQERLPCPLATRRRSQARSGLHCPHTPT